MKRVFAFIALLNLFAFSEDEVAVADVQTNLLIVSESVERKAFTRQPVLAGPNNELIDASGVLASFAEMVAIDDATEEVKDISMASSVALTNALEYLTSNTNRMAENSYTFAIEFAPERTSDNLVGYVVDEQTDGLTDTQWVWYNKALGLAPDRFVVYEYFGGCVTQAVTWADVGGVRGWNTNGVSRAGYTGVHKCTVTRPTFAQDVTCLTMANDSFGGASGFAFGSMLVRIDGLATYTGYVTNATDAVWAYFDNGVLKETGAVE